MAYEFRLVPPWPPQKGRIFHSGRQVCSSVICQKRFFRVQYYYLKIEGKLDFPGSAKIDGEVIDSNSFFTQFIGRSKADKLELNKNIENITGATKSAEASIDLISTTLSKVCDYINENSTK